MERATLNYEGAANDRICDKDLCTKNLITKVKKLKWLCFSKKCWLQIESVVWPTNMESTSPILVCLDSTEIF